MELLGSKHELMQCIIFQGRLTLLGEVIAYNMYMRE